MPLSPDSEMPTSIGPFRVVRILGCGAMGVVYLGERTEQFQQRVAIKVLHAHVSLLSGRDVLQHEEKVLTSLDHTAIVRLLDAGEYKPGVHYIVMEYVDGVPIDLYCRQGSLTREQRIALLIEVARAVDYAHQRLVIHADLKPQNILVTADGTPRILDFGVAILAEPDTVAVQAPSRHTPAYASPEQRSDARVTATTDLYSLGRIAGAVLNDDGNPAQHASRDLRAILLEATDPEPEQRYATASALADDLQALLDHRPVTARNGNTLYRSGKWMRQHRATAAIAVALATILMATVTGVALQTVRAARQRRVTQARLYDLVRLTGTLEGELYTSAHALPQGGEASASLLTAATASLDRLAATGGADSSLALEMAQQYATLAHLERTQGAEQAAQQNLAKGVALLQAVPPNDRNHTAAEAEIHRITDR